ncbi:uncharacterized protein LOC119461405 [Dermacentor silvarum]|uniref:uncharacterized protein LOC119461405 n=1 Tax=Dermacentor silvarum TaxID=543639 RepID=UPI00189B8521|nr:uncharacterized protein LOC119461405 [Dermacentor silvarum]
MDAKSVAFALLCTAFAVNAQSYGGGIRRVPGDFSEGRPGGLVPGGGLGGELAGGFPGGYPSEVLKGFEKAYREAIPAGGRKDFQVGMSTQEASREELTRHFAEIASALSELVVWCTRVVVCDSRATLSELVSRRRCTIMHVKPPET